MFSAKALQGPTMQHMVQAGDSVDLRAAIGSPSRKTEADYSKAQKRRPTYIAQGISIVFDAGLLFLYGLTGTTTFATCFAFLSCGIVTTLFFLVLSELHVNDRFKNHYLTVPQCVCSTTMVLFAVYLAPEVGFYFICINFIILGFGALSMSARQTAIVWTFSTVGLTVLFLMTDAAIAMPTSSWAERALALACFATLFGRCAFTGLYGSSMREMLYKRGNELKEAHARIEELAQIDELTGSLNRRYIMASLKEEMIRSQRSSVACSVAIMDLDYFKRINDGFGHPAGDEVLRAFAIAISSNIRVIDRFGRYGGEEFLLIMPGTHKAQAVQTLDRLRGIFAVLDWTSISKDMQLTVSAGVCEVGLDDTPESLLARADRALYQAKDAGRNRVVVA